MDVPLLSAISRIHRRPKKTKKASELVEMLLSEEQSFSGFVFFNTKNPETVPQEGLSVNTFDEHDACKFFVRSMVRNRVEFDEELADMDPVAIVDYLINEQGLVIFRGDYDRDTTKHELQVVYARSRTLTDLPVIDRRVVQAIRDKFSIPDEITYKKSIYDKGVTVSSTPALRYTRW